MVSVTSYTYPTETENDNSQFQSQTQSQGLSQSLRDSIEVILLHLMRWNKAACSIIVEHYLKMPLFVKFSEIYYYTF
ncbi:Uncharacterised protein [Escherichia coli]|uniref:Uncharacterized protein n=1 Tax=Escherichia coli TaxID=562 RepID=A0A485JA86_ECOLX|nr:Uncharacterised protein [Escherichia coli]